MGLHVTQCGLGWGLPSYQVASWSIQPFGHNRQGPKIGKGGCAPWGLNWVRAESYHRTKLHLDRSSHLASIDMGRKLAAVPFLGGGELGPHSAQCGLGPGLPLYQVTSWLIQPFGHNRHGPKIGGGCAPFWERGAVSPSSTMLPGSRPTSTPNVILIHPTIWPQYTNVTDRETDRQDRTTVR